MWIFQAKNVSLGIFFTKFPTGIYEEKHSLTSISSLKFKTFFLRKIPKFVLIDENKFPQFYIVLETIWISIMDI